MVSRWRRHLDLLQAIDMEPSFDKHPDDHWSTKMRDRPMHKDEIQQVCQILGLDDDGTVPELRDRIRETIFEDKRYGTWRNPQDSKAGTSQFSTSELLGLIRAVNHELRLDFEDVWPEIDDVFMEGDVVRIDGEEYVIDNFYDGPHDGTVAEKELPLDEFVCVEFKGGENKHDRRYRLVMMNELDMDECKYNHSVVLEKARDFGPWKRWKKDSYVKEVEFHVDA